MADLVQDLFHAAYAAGHFVVKSIIDVNWFFFSFFLHAVESVLHLMTGALHFAANSLGFVVKETAALRLPAMIIFGTAALLLVLLTRSVLRTSVQQHVRKPKKQ